MKLAVITDSSAYLKPEVLEKENLFILDIPVFIDGKTYVEGKNLTAEEFYQKMALSAELPKTSQPSIAELEDLLSTLAGNGYTHVLGLFLSSGISGFYQNIQFLKDEFPQLEIAFPDSKITSAPLGIMVQSARLIELVEERTSSGKYEIIVIHANAVDKAETLRQSLLESNISAEVSLATFGSVIGTHLGEGSIALGYIPLFD